MMNEETKTTADLAFGGVTVGAFFEALPEITALVALCWWMLRIWETETVKRLTGRQDNV
jgi:hypothetical protein